MAEERDQPSQVILPSNGSDPSVGPDWERSLRRVVRSELRRSLPSVTEVVARRLGHDEEIAGLIHLLAAKSNDARDEVLRKALTLYGLALDARERGNKLVILGPDDEIIHDVIGFDSLVS